MLCDNPPTVNTFALSLAFHYQEMIPNNSAFIILKVCEVYFFSLTVCVCFCVFFQDEEQSDIVLSAAGECFLLALVHSNINHSSQTFTLCWSFWLPFLHFCRWCDSRTRWKGSWQGEIFAHAYVFPLHLHAQTQYVQTKERQLLALKKWSRCKLILDHFSRLPVSGLSKDCMMFLLYIMIALLDSEKMIKLRMVQCKFIVWLSSC